MNPTTDPTTHDRFPELLTVPETARLLRISRNLAYELVARHQIPAIHLGRVIRVPKSGLQGWLDQQFDDSRIGKAENFRDLRL